MFNQTAIPRTSSVDRRSAPIERLNARNMLLDHFITSFLAVHDGATLLSLFSVLFRLALPLLYADLAV